MPDEPTQKNFAALVSPLEGQETLGAALRVSREAWIMSEHIFLALSDVQRSLLRRLVDTAVPGARVAVFGSRATGRARPFSDVDLLVLKPAPLTWQQRTALRDAFEASELPFHVDVVEVASIPAAMLARIQTEAVPL